MTLSEIIALEIVKTFGRAIAVTMEQHTLPKKLAPPESGQTCLSPNGDGNPGVDTKLPIAYGSNVSSP